MQRRYSNKHLKRPGITTVVSKEIDLPDQARSVLRRAEYCAEDIEYRSIDDLIDAHRSIHLEFGDAPNDLVLDIERQLSDALRRYGIEHRYQDALSVAAGTKRSVVRAPTLYEVGCYLGTIGLSNPAIKLVKPVDEPANSKNDAAGSMSNIYVDIVSDLIKGVAPSVIYAMQRTMPPGIVLKDLAEAPQVGFIETLPAYGLDLHAYGAERYASAETSTWEHITKEFRASAAQASVVFKDMSRNPRIPFSVRVTKDGGPHERIVTGVVLEPGVIDGTRDEATGTEGDTYTAEEITKGMHWWMENASQQASYLHVDKGGEYLGRNDVILLENWQTRVPQKLGEQDIPAGTWVSTERVLKDELWSDILAGKILSWSIGAHAMGAVERIAV